MQKGAKQIAEKGATLWAISYDSAETIEKVKKDLNLSLSLLSDQESRVIDLFGVLNSSAKGKKAGIAIPTTFIIDKDGTIKAKLAHDSVRDRHGPAEIIAELEKL